MHIPDGYLGPQTTIPVTLAMMPIWRRASRVLSEPPGARRAPMLALGAAFSFLIMMFNIPVPGGTTGHAVGSVLVAILLGPWAAVAAVSLALAVQALLFGDGGVTTLAANCLNMAVLMPFAGWWAYRMIAGSSPPESRRHVIGAAVGGYLGINAAALGTAVLFGIQPLIAVDAAGRPLYSPFGLSVAVPVMALEHLLFFGFIEAAATGWVVRYFQRTEPSLLPRPGRPRPGDRPATPETGRATPGRSGARMACGIALMALLTPIGFWIPSRFGAGAAWGEWDAGELSRMAGYLPGGMRRLESLWSAPLPGYAMPAGSDGPVLSSMAYLLSAFAGAAAIGLLVGFLRRLIARRA